MAKYEDLVKEAKSFADRNDKMNAARARTLAKVVKTGCDRNDENNRKRAVTTIKAIKAHDERSEKRAERIERTVRDDGEKTRDHIDRVVGSVPLSFGQWLGCCFVGFVVGFFGFLFYLGGAERGVFLCTTNWTVQRDAAGNFIANVATYEPWLVAIWIFATVTAVVGFLITYAICSNYNARNASEED